MLIFDRYGGGRRGRANATAEVKNKVNMSFLTTTPHFFKSNNYDLKLKIGKSSRKLIKCVEVGKTGLEFLVISKMCPYLDIRHPINTQ